MTVETIYRTFIESDLRRPGIEPRLPDLQFNSIPFELTRRLLCDGLTRGHINLFSKKYGHYATHITLKDGL
jgi:hypothetical protein